MILYTIFAEETIAFSGELLSVKKIRCIGSPTLSSKMVYSSRTNVICYKWTTRVARKGAEKNGKGNHVTA